MKKSIRSYILSQSYTVVQRLPSYALHGQPYGDDLATYDSERTNHTVSYLITKIIDHPRGNLSCYPREVARMHVNDGQRAE